MQLLDLQSSGVSPQVLGQQVQPTLDFLPFYTGQVERTEQGASIALGTSGDFGTSLAVPAGQIWLLRQATFSVGAAASGSFVGNWRLERGAASAYLPTSTPLLLSIAGAFLCTYGSWQPTPPILLRGGDRFIVEAGGVFGSPGTFGFVSAYYARLA